MANDAAIQDVREEIATPIRLRREPAPADRLAMTPLMASFAIGAVLPENLVTPEPGTADNRAGRLEPDPVKYSVYSDFRSVVDGRRIVRT